MLHNNKNISDVSLLVLYNICIVIYMCQISNKLNCLKHLYNAKYHQETNYIIIIDFVK